MRVELNANETELVIYKTKEDSASWFSAEGKQLRKVVLTIAFLDSLQWSKSEVHYCSSRYKVIYISRGAGSNHSAKHC